MKRYYFYAHGGSGNHGCEAIVRSTVAQLNPEHTCLISNAPQQDEKYGLFDVCPVLPQRLYSVFRYSPKKIFNSLIRRITGNIDPIMRNNFKVLFTVIKKNDIAVSIGGDNYCYATYTHMMGALNRMLTKKGIKTALWGCSVEPDLVKQPEIAADLKRYSLITARESITYQALLDAGVNQNTNLVPDPAFGLTIEPTELPEGFLPGKTIGLNVSKLVQRYEKNNGMIMENIKQLMNYILEETDFSVAFVPHVVWPKDDDREPLNALYELYRESGRVFLAEDQNCSRLKHVISQCRMFIGARTHATIAAYSTCVPTIVLGYSVKSRGIARDIFGERENYVLPVDNLASEFELKKAFLDLLENETSVRTHLESFMPAYIERSKTAGALLETLREKG